MQHFNTRSAIPHPLILSSLTSSFNMANPSAPVENVARSEAEAEAEAEADELKPLALYSRTYGPTQVGHWLCRDASLPVTRQMLAGFASTMAVVLSGEQYALFWPYVSNVWTATKRRSQARPSDGPEGLKRSRVEYTHYVCKFHRHWEAKGKGMRSRTSCTAIQPCQASLKVSMAYASENDDTAKCAEKASTYLSRDSQSAYRILKVTVEFVKGHNTHNFEDCDQHKVNDGILTACQQALLAHECDKSAANRTWKKDKASQALAALCGLKKTLRAQEWANYAMKVRAAATASDEGDKEPERVPEVQETHCVKIE